MLVPLRPLLPHGGLARGTVTVAPDLGTLLALAAGPARADRYGGYTSVIDCRTSDWPPRPRTGWT
ncbi:hypothetical protein ABZX88_33190 [Kitasatospora aureofaciens]|uniref:hypothetical protein n=1 Tax=Kitasatospora aureofaciens TaxID=1894 RepID=UPI0033A6E1BF